MTEILFTSLENYFSFFVYKKEARSLVYQNFKHKLLLFLEDYTIVPTLLQARPKHELSMLNSNMADCNPMVFRTTKVLIQAQQLIFYKNSTNQKGFGRLNIKPDSARFSKFAARFNDFCMNQIVKLRRDNRDSYGDIGELLLEFIDPLRVSL